ncbi:MAG TPA: Fe-S cluster assembly protein SufD [Rhodospirillaceae bacterium]|nr:Fe-S cluster assembly protein SufD [Rhodospirillaceae bacterium]
MSVAALIQQSHDDKEAWRYTSLADFAAQAWGAPTVAAMPELPAPLTRHRLVIVDGVFRDDLSARQELPNEFFDRCEEKDNCYALTLWNRTCLAIDPIEVLFVNTHQVAANEATTKIKIALGKSSRLTLIEQHVGLNGAASARLIEMDIELDAQAKLVHGKIVTGGQSSLHHARAMVRVAAGAFYDHFALVAGGKLVRCEKEVALVGEMAEARFSGVMLLRGSDHGDITTLVRHLAPHGISRQVCKTVLADKARGVFAGKVFVDQTAQKTDAYQLCRALLLSDQAEMDAKPELEIYADDVKCSHGTAIGDLDDKALFYLLSRGIDPDAARAMLVEAFVGELVDTIQSPDLADAVRDEVQKWLA